MKKTILLLTILIQGCENQGYLSKNEKTQELTTTSLEIRDGLAFLPQSNELFTGKFYATDTLAAFELEIAIKEQNENKGIGAEQTYYANGSGNRSLTALFKNSEFKDAYTFKNGVLHGLKQLLCLKDDREYECGSKNYKNGIPSGLEKSYTTDKGLYLVSLNLGGTQESDISVATKNLVTDEDKIEKHIWYHDIASLSCSGTGISAYMNRTEHNSIVLRCKLNYESDNFLIIKSIIIAADNQRFEKTDLTFERGSSYDGIKEWYDYNVLDDDLKIIKTIINAKEVTIRFKGESGYNDYVVTEKEKKSLNNIVDAYEALLLLAT